MVLMNKILSGLIFVLALADFGKNLPVGRVRQSEPGADPDIATRLQRVRAVTLADGRVVCMEPQKRSTTGLRRQLFLASP